jgi:tetratricopeptide (TPR) repeat protein
MNNKLIARIAIIVALLIGARFITSFFPDMRLWGFNHAAFLNYAEFIYLIFIAATAYIYIRRDKFSALVRESDPSLSEHDRGKYFLTYAVVLVICGAGFYLLRVKSHFLGDGLTIIANPEMGIKYRELGEVIIHKWFVSQFGTLTSDSVLLAHRTLSIASGLLFSVALVFYGKRITTTRFNLRLFLLLVLMSGHTVLFYGYVENYSITTAVLGVSILAATASLRNGNKSLIPIIGLIIAVFLHTVSLVYFPAILLYVFLAIGGTKIRTIITRKSGAILLGMIILLFIGYLVVRLWAPLFWRMAILPPLGDRFTIDNYFLLSPRHLIDYVNLLFLLIPVTLVIWILTLVSRRRATTHRTGPEHLFLVAATIFGLVAAFILEPKLGMARDWDLMSILLIGGAVYGIYYWVDHFNGKDYFRPASMILVIMGLSIFIPWLTLNNTTDALARYSTAVMQLDPRHSRPGLQTMGAYMEKHGNIDEARRLARDCDINFPEIKLNREGGSLFRRGQYSLAESKLRLALKENPSWFGLYLDLGMCQLKLKRPAEALENLKIADGLNPYSAYIYNYLGDAYMALADTARALRYWHRSTEQGEMVSEAYLSLGVFHLMERRPDSAMYYLSQLQDTRVTIDICYWMGLASYMLKDTVGAIEAFDTYLRLGNDSGKIENINKFKSEITKDKP